MPLFWIHVCKWKNYPANNFRKSWVLLKRNKIPIPVWRNKSHRNPLYERNLKIREREMRVAFPHLKNQWWRSWCFRQCCWHFRELQDNTDDLRSCCCLFIYVSSYFSSCTCSSYPRAFLNHHPSSDKMIIFTLFHWVNNCTYSFGSIISRFVVSPVL